MFVVICSDFKVYKMYLICKRLKQIYKTLHRSVIRVLFKQVNTVVINGNAII